MTPEQFNVARDVMEALGDDLDLGFLRESLYTLHRAPAKDNKTFEFIDHGFRIYMDKAHIDYRTLMKCTKALSEMYGRRFAPGSLGIVKEGGISLLYVEFTFGGHRKNA